ncbi:hypothetical protein K9L05_02925 [Candidatus Babeliales bacterium]|nr:hypothetical protein [Candidatus Babeliales bacterium]MCF7899576.1 hypothetical protein [Candidatus Babeliales bacterium]
MNNLKTLDKFFLFAGDQKIEHLNKDFYGQDIPEECLDPKHFFDIASQSKISAFATQLGLIDLYARDFENINYIVKLNSKTDLIPTKISDPISLLLNTVEEVIEFKKSTGLPIIGIGYTVYLGSKYEAKMLQQAAQAVFKAHQNGLIAILWMYPRGISIKNELDVDLISGAAGVGACLGADFVKVNVPQAKNIIESSNLLKIVSGAAGKTKVLCSGGKKEENKEKFLEKIYYQIKIGDVSGCAIGRNIYQNKVEDAIKFCNALASIIFDDADVELAKKFL